MFSFLKRTQPNNDSNEQDGPESVALRGFNVDEDDLTISETGRGRRFLRKKEFQVNFLFLSNAVVFIIVGLSIILTRYMDTRVPDPVLSVNAGSSVLKFSEERARRDLEHLTSVGVRVSGSEATDVTTVDNILNALTLITTDSGSSKFFYLDFQIQRPAGSFYIDRNGGFTSIYAGVANVVAKLEPKDGANDSVLVNCHFDTKPGTPGASDNMISCVTMLEVIRTLYNYRSDEISQVLKNTIVFLFNGDEEMYLQGAHGFIRGDGGQGHEWAEDLRCFVNLEAAGSGGREVLFQSGPGNGWILSSYARSALHPYASVFAEEIFQAGLIPSDTDFRIFRDHKNIPGLDMAFVKNGWVYHTKWDRAADIPPGSIQNMGDNVLALVLDLGNLDFKEVEKSDSQMVFFDVLGLFVVSYSKTIGIVLGLITAIIFIALVLLEVGITKSRRKLVILPWLLISASLAWGTGIATGALVGCFFNGMEYYKPFYSYPFMAILLFGLPAIFAQALVFSFAWDGSQRMSWLAGKFTMAVGLLVSSFFIRGSYVLFVILLFAALAWVPRRFIFDRYQNPCCRTFQLFSDVLVGELFPLLIALPLVFQSDFLVPITGRSGPGLNPNVAIGILTAASVAILALSGLGTYLVSLKKIHLIIALLLSFFLVNPMIVMGFVGKIPYQTKTPMRLRIVNTDRTWYNSDRTLNRSDSGYWFQPVDPDMGFYLPEFAKTVPELSQIKEIEANSDTCSELFCSQPLVWPTGKSTKQTPWLPTTTRLPTSIVDAVQIREIQVRKDGLSQNVTLTFEGPAQNTIVLSPGEAFELKNWSLESPPKMIEHMKFKDRPAYFLYLGKGYYTPSFSFSLELVRKGENTSTDQTLLDIMYVGHFMDPNITEPNFQSFLDQFPSWTNLMTWSSVVKQYSITV